MLEGVAALLDRARRDPAAEQEIAAARAAPSYPQCLGDLIADPSRGEDFRVFAAIELRRLCSAGLSPAVPPGCWAALLQATHGRVQRQIERILAEFVQSCFASDRVLLPLAIARGEFAQRPLPAILILARIARTALRVRHGDSDCLFDAVCPFLPAALELCRAAPADSALLRASLRLASAVCRCRLPEPIGGWTALVAAVFESRAPAALEKPAARLAGLVLQQHWEKWSLEAVLSVFRAIARRLADASLSYTAVAPAFAFCRGACAFDACARAVAGGIPQFLGAAVLPHFCLGAEHERMIAEDLFGFLHETDAVLSDSPCPISGARDFLSICGQRADWQDAALDIALAELQADGGVARWYGALLFAGSALAATPIDWRPPRLPALLALAGRSDHFVAAAGFCFLIGHMADHLVPGAEFLAAAIEMLREGHPLCRYAAATAITKLLPAHRECADFSPEFGVEIVRRVLELNRAFPTDAMATAVRVVCDVFMSELVPLAIPVARELFAIFREYACMEEQALAAGWIRRTIERLFGHMNGQNQEFWDACIEEWGMVIDGVSASQWVETLTILGAIVRMTPFVSAAFGGLPCFLLKLAKVCIVNGECMSEIADVIAWLALRAPDWLSSEANFGPVAELLGDTLALFNGHEMDLCNSVTLLSQAVFIVMREYELPRALFDAVLPMVSELCREGLADVIAALATMFPVPVLAHETHFMVWIAYASPAPFLLSVVSLMPFRDSLPPNLSGHREEIAARVAEQIGALLDDAPGLLFCSETLSRIFDPESLLSFWRSPEFCITVS